MRITLHGQSLEPEDRVNAPPEGHESSQAAAAMRGDRAAIAALWQEHRRWVAAVLLAHKPRSVDLEDLLQDVAMTLFTKIHGVREVSNLRAWLRTVAVNAALAAARSERARPTLRLVRPDDSPSADHSPEKSLGGSEHARRLMALVEQLPEAYREPLLLKAVHGLRTRQISEILDLPEATIDTRVSRGRRMLRELEAAEFDGADRARAAESVSWASRG